MCCTLVALPLNVVLVPSPKSTNTEVIAFPVVGVAVMLKIVGVPTAGVCVDAVRVTIICGFGVTVTLPVPLRLIAKRIDRRHMHADEPGVE